MHETISPNPTSPSNRDLQRTALRDLVAICTECAATEIQIEKRYSVALEEGTKEYDRGVWTVEERLKTARENTDKEHQTRLGQIQGQYQADFAALNQAAEASRRRVEHDKSAIERQIKQQLEQASWLAESVYDGTQARIHDELKQAKETLGSQTELLEEMRQRVTGLLNWYNQKPPAAAPGQSQTPPTVCPEELRDAAPEGEFVFHRDAAERLVQALGNLSVPRVFVGARPHFAAFFLCAAAVGMTQVAISTTEPQWKPMAIALGISVAVLAGLGMVLWSVAKAHLRGVCIPLEQYLAAAGKASQNQFDAARRRLDELHVSAVTTHDAEVKKAHDKAAPILEQAVQKHQSATQALEAQRSQQLLAIERQRDSARIETEQWWQRALVEMRQRHERELAAATQRHEQRTAAAERSHTDSRAALEQRLADGLASIQAPIESALGDGQLIRDWNDPVWRTWTPPRKFTSLIRLGQLHVDLQKIAQDAAGQAKLKLQLPPAFALPVGLTFPSQASLLIQTDRAGREQSLQVLQMVMARLLTGLPPGRVRFTIIDPVGLGHNFAGFMHLADHDDALVGGRIWTEADHIEQRLANLTEHMETVIQKYLRNEFATIDDYNAQAGELAEPYRFLVISDYPVSFAGDAFRRLSSIATSGARCGVYTLILRDTRQPLPPASGFDDLEAHSLNLVREADRFLWKDPIFRQFPLSLDEAPPENILKQILDIVGRHAKELKRVEVPFENITPPPDKLWSASSDDDLAVPVGKMGATRLQSFRLGRGVAQHALIAGKTGSGKSTLLHVLVTNLALWYPPDQVEFYLVDFKKGVEFKTYATHALPHARAIAVESDREFGLSVLQRIDAELTRRGELYRKLGVQDLASYRALARNSALSTQPSALPTLPRTLLVVDEFQEFFSEDDKLAQDAALLLDRLVRQGRAFGIHVLLGSQTIGGTSGLSRSTLGQMAVRVALQCSEADSQMILGDANSAARLLSRPGEAIYNDAGGLVESNSPFQVTWLPDETRDRCLKQISNLKSQIAHPPPIVFEGNVPADIIRNQRLAKLLGAYQAAAAGAEHPPTAPCAYLGEPVAIKDPTAVVFRRQSGANLIIIGQHEESALAMLSSALISLAAQHAPGSARFYVLDGAPADSPLAGRLAQLREVLPQEIKLIEYRSVPDMMAELADELHARQSHSGLSTQDPGLFMVIFGLQRYRVLRKQEESFNFSATDEEKKPQADKLFAELLRDGPALGIHTLAWCDTATSIDRTLDRTGLREFDHRVLFQMSATDSSNLIDSPLANKLGFYRALAFSEEQGTLEKFRPYALPDKSWLEYVKSSVVRAVSP
jgi:hypothetical protein